MRILPMLFTTLSLIAVAGDHPAARDVAPLTPAQIHTLLTSPLRHVRAVDARAARVIAEGLRGSRTFAHLVAALDHTDVIVYVETVTTLPASLSGRMLLSAAPRGPRYVRVQVQAYLHPKEIVAALGHELVHALEVSQDPEVTDDASLVRLYERIGLGGKGTTHFDTIAAQNAGRRVRSELL